MFIQNSPSTIVTSRFLLCLGVSDRSLFSLFSSFLKRFATCGPSSFLEAEGPVQITEGRAAESVLVGLLLLAEEYSEEPVFIVVGDGLVVKVMKVGEVEVSDTRGEVGLEAIAAS